MEIADLDGSGTIDLEEFQEFVLKVDEKKNKDTMENTFKFTDADGDGELSIQEFG